MSPKCLLANCLCALWVLAIKSLSPLDGVTNPNDKLLDFLTTIFLQSEEGTSFQLEKVLSSSALFMADSLILTVCHMYVGQMFVG